MSILKEIGRALFKQQKRRVSPVKRMTSKPVRKRIRRENIPTQIPVTSPQQKAAKRSIKVQTPFRAVINIAGMFAGQRIPCDSIRLTKIPLPDKENGKLRIQATDLESWFSGTITHKDSDNRDPMGQLCVYAKTIKKVIAGMNGTANIKLFKHGIDINDYSVPASCKVEEFPSILEPTKISISENRAYKIADIGQKLAFLKHALAKADTYSMAHAAIYFDLKTGRLVTTDGRRMHITPTGKEGYNPKYAGKDIMVLPKILKVAKVLSGQFMLLNKGEHKRIVFGLDIPDCQAEAGYNLIEGQYPRYTEVIPSEFCGKCIVEKEELLIALRKSIPATTEEDSGARFDFSAKGMRINVSRFKAVLTNAEYKGDLFVGSMDPRYLLDAIDMPDETVEILLPKSRNSAWTVRGSQSKYMAVIMPIGSEEKEV